MKVYILTMQYNYDKPEIKGVYLDEVKAEEEAGKMNGLRRGRTFRGITSYDLEWVVEEYEVIE